jgi:hypothetical protein
MNSELENTWKEVVMAKFEIQFWCSGETEGRHDSLKIASECLDMSVACI